MPGKDFRINKCSTHAAPYRAERAASRFQELVTAAVLPCLLLALAVSVSFARELKYEVTAEDLLRMSPAMRNELAGLQYLMNPYQVRQFVHLPSDSARQHWIEVFWKAKDPTPLTEENEMRREHEIRVRLARKFFPLKHWPGWDKRGEVFIRYGPPSFRGKIWGEVTHRDMYPPREVWYYKKHDMLVSFQNFGLKGEYIYAIDPLGSAEELSPDMIEFLLYDTDEALSSRFSLDLLQRSSRQRVPEGSIGDRVPKLPENIDALIDPDRAEITPVESAIVFERDRIRESANNFETVLNETPATYPFNFNRKSLPFYFDVDEFKAGPESTRVEVHAEIPFRIDEAEDNLDFELAAVVWDTGFKDVGRAKRSISVEIKGDRRESTRLIPSLLVFTLPRGYYRLAVEAREDSTGSSSSYRTAFTVEDFGGELAISNILFARRISPAVGSSIFNRGPLEVIPHPIHAYRRGFTMPIYFEIYNLRLDERGSSSYTIEYKITPKGRFKTASYPAAAEPIVSSSFNGSGSTRDEPHHLKIRTDNLARGTYEFLITVTDENARATASRRAFFSILE